jgi:ASTRA-associated protein 1
VGPGKAYHVSLAAPSYASPKITTDISLRHGKDNKLIVWKLAVDDEASMSTVLPVEDSISPRKQPWLLHVLQVNTLNFCSFAYCTVQEPTHEARARDIVTGEHTKELLIAVPNTLISESVSSNVCCHI